MIRIRLDCVRPTQFSAIRLIQCNVNLKCFLFIYQKCTFVIIIHHFYSSIHTKNCAHISDEHLH